MSDSVLTPERILAAAEDVLRRYGPGKATVVDVAQALGVSHGSVYRHFASKAALREAVLRGWLARSMAPLQAIADSRTPPPARLRQWFSTLRQTKRDNVLGDPSCSPPTARWRRKQATPSPSTRGTCNSRSPRSSPPA